MATKIFTVDAFTDRLFAGNPAAVCLLEDDSPSYDDGWMQAVAAEMNLSETAFVRFSRDRQSFMLRWFTPVVEVPLCGHATLASAHVLYEEGIVPADRSVEFETLSGRLTAQKSAEGIELDFPLQPVTLVTDSAVPVALRQGLDVSLVEVAADDICYVVELEDAETVRNLQPDLALLRTLDRRVIVTCRADTHEFDFISRSFLPNLGIPEDPVTGASHCSLADYWRLKLGKESFTAYQASLRGGTVGVRIEGDRVKLTGHAVTVLSGTFNE